ncbi:hypothetical protein E4O93_08565 [Diaphorobacter sp. DS2]|jgi:hypothetical protein|uniref:hypothetical protein n=1 Tax=unclassified Diaphorobacter TaxID=2649760 RepID=UPI00059FEC9F|nr:MULTISPECIES: hypothetical protein [unclassified Diaphorobacter]POR12165.1 hypothetical protein BV908_04650 [Diaphorobacter sp. LR2014-1]QPN30496.1 hypothetical protein I3K84_17135 [Diaphorobacter sp. JS3051]TFI48244.1 hypothetical protein E4O93_08565 [Diaphorobacter sp. DS2]
MSTNRTPASYARAKLAGERQQAFTTAMTYARALRDLTRPGSVSPPPPRRQLAPLVHAWAEAMKHVLNAEE